MRNTILIISAIILGAFALLTFYLSGSLIFDLFGMREKQGIDFVPFVAWVNLISSILYFASAFGLAFKQTWTTLVLSITLALLALTFVVYILYINTGGPHLEQTFGALIFRMGVTLIFTTISYALITRKGNM